MHTPVVGDAEPPPWPTPNNGSGDGGGGEIQGWCLFKRVQLLLVTLNPCLGKHQTTAAGNCITTLTGLNNNSHRCKPMVMRRNLYYNPNGVEQRMPQDAPRPTPNQYNVVGIFIKYPPVVGDAEPLPWPTPTTAAGSVAGNSITTLTGLKCHYPVYNTNASLAQFPNVLLLKGPPF